MPIETVDKQYDDDGKVTHEPITIPSAVEFIPKGQLGQDQPVYRRWAIHPDGKWENFGTTPQTEAIEERMYVCGECGQRIIDTYELKNHLTDEHTDVNSTAV